MPGSDNVSPVDKVAVIGHRGARNLWPLLFTTDKNMATAVIGLKNLIPQSDSEPAWNVAMNGALLVMLPPVVVVMLLQRWFVKGLVESEK